jgi:putative DNA primase/helicase
VIAGAKPYPQTSEQSEQSEQSEEKKEDATDADVEIERLAKLSKLEYEQQRKTAAEKLEVRASILDKLVEAERIKLNPDAGKPGQGEPIEFPEPELWPDEVKGAELLTEIATTIRSHVVMSNREHDICALWAVYTHLVGCFLVAPRLAISSPTPECGKTTLLDVLEHLVLKPLRTSSVTASVTFRVIAMCQPTLLIDEAKNIADKTDLLEVLNDGHRRGGRTLRNVPIGDGYEPRGFATFAALAIALIGSLPPELHGRSLVIDLKRRLPGDVIKGIRVGRNEHLDTLARKAARWAADNALRIADMEPVMPAGIYSRAADNWKPLLAVADAAGGEWPQRARDAAAKSHAAADVDDASMVELLLADIRTSFAEKGKAEVVGDLFAKKVDVEFSSADLVKALVEIEGRPWAELGKSRKPLTTHGLAKKLKPLGIGPDRIGPKDGRLRGYKLTQFEEAFERYLPPEGVSKCPPVHHAANTGTSDISEVSTPDSGWTVAKCEKPNNDGLVDRWTLAKGGNGEKTHARTPKARSDDLPYTLPPVDVPDLGPDPLDDHGVPVAANFVATIRAMLGNELFEKIKETCLDSFEELDAPSSPSIAERSRVNSRPR